MAVLAVKCTKSLLDIIKQSLSVSLNVSKSASKSLASANKVSGRS